MKYLQDVDFSDKKVLLRVDYNVPIGENGDITDDTRIKATIPTMRHILHSCKQLIVMTHFGRPKNVQDTIYKTDKLAEHLAELLGTPVKKIDGCAGMALPEDELLFLENLRFYPEEEKNDELFARALASYADIYVDEAFSNAHRNHASMTGILKFIPGCAGLLFQKEMEGLSFEKEDTAGTFVAILGGSKISTKFGIINSLVKQVDYLLVGGAMMFTFYKAKGYEIGKSLIENDQVTLAQMLLHNEKIILPVDVVLGKDVHATTSTTVAANAMPKDMIGLDIGPETVALFTKYLNKAHIVFWNGPLGYCENDVFAKGTDDLIKVMSLIQAKTIVGGGDTIAVIEKLGLADKFNHVSTAGGAALEYIEKGTLPAIKALNDNEVEFFH